MSYDSVERSEAGRRPVELYTFAREFQFFRYTSADRDITVDGAEFKARSISRGGIEASQEMIRSGIQVTAQRDLEVVDLFRIAPPSVPVTLVLQQFHEGDGELATIWSGRILSVEWEGANAQISLEPIYTGLRRIGLRRAFQRQCPHVLYGAQCKANREAFRIEGQVDSATGTAISVGAADAQVDGYFAGGFVEYPIELGLFERRFIVDHAGAVLTLDAQPVGMVIGSTVKLYPGCDHTASTCSSKFSNILNYGGMPYFTLKNPFGGDPVF